MCLIDINKEREREKERREIKVSRNYVKRLHREKEFHILASCVCKLLTYLYLIS